ncbi:MAG: hypothetical protein M1831_006948 [Alyxoria varia]|nr:MAG: hypothetical protein M1831_006948 [Alyxoria varia]
MTNTQNQTQSGKKAVRHVRIFNSENNVHDNSSGISNPMTVVISAVSGLIETIKDSPTSITTADEEKEDAVPTAFDGRAGTSPSSAILLPGLIDAHIHPKERHHLLQLAQYGVTTAYDMASWPPERSQALRRDPGGSTFAVFQGADKGRADAHQARDSEPGSDSHSAVAGILTSCMCASCPGSRHSKIPTFPTDSLLSSAEEAPAFVDQQVRNGADYIKIVADAPVGPSQEVLDAIVHVAHSQKYGKKVVAHAANFRAYEMAMACGADIITHVPRDTALSHEIVRKIAARNVVCLPTLAVMKVIVNSPMALPGDSYEDAAVVSVKRLAEAGVKMYVGSDSNTVPGPMCMPFGSSLLKEVETLVNDGGLDPAYVLRMATKGNAELFGLDKDRGVVEEGMRADLTVIEGNPVYNVENVRNVRQVWVGGKEVDLKARES